MRAKPDIQITRRWTIERRVPITLFLTLGVQILLLVSWATHLEARVGTLELQDARLQPVGESMARLEERVESMRQDITHMRGQLDKLGEVLLRGR